jgi:hypothetical protein
MPTAQPMAIAFDALQMDTLPVASILAPRTFRCVRCGRMHEKSQRSLPASCSSDRCRRDALRAHQMFEVIRKA